MASSSSSTTNSRPKTPLIFLPSDPEIPMQLGNPLEKAPNYPRIVNITLFNKDTTDTSTLTLADAVVTLLFNWSVMAVHQCLDVKGLSEYYFKLRIPEGKFVGALVAQRQGDRITVGYEDKLTRLWGDQIACEIQEDRTWKPVSVRYPHQSSMSVAPAKVDKAAREMAVKILGMKAWEGAGKMRYQSRPTPQEGWIK
ncbi:MAG: hypothetical protein MMC33_008606 [Icmadophila ericetorum]|nr:hypothetical protein [Icmadophila ericetorum]